MGIIKIKITFLSKFDKSADKFTDYIKYGFQVFHVYCVIIININTILI